MINRAMWPNGRRVARPRGMSPHHHRKSARGTSASAERKKTISPSGTAMPKALMQAPMAAKASVDKMRSAIPRVSPPVPPPCPLCAALIGQDSRSARGRCRSSHRPWPRCRERSRPAHSPSAAGFGGLCPHHSSPRLFGTPWPLYGLGGRCVDAISASPHPRRSRRRGAGRLSRGEPPTRSMSGAIGFVAARKPSLRFRRPTIKPPSCRRRSGSGGPASRSRPAPRPYRRSAARRDL